jgi:proline iminopeptidase
LRDHFDIVFCDSRQWAATPAGYDVATLTRSTFADDAEKVRAATGLERPVVVGHSMHAAMALQYAHEHPDQARGVVAVAAHPPGGVPLDAVVEFFLADASPERQAAYARRREAGPVHETVTTSREYIDNYLSQSPAGWYDMDYDGAWLWDGVEVNVDVMRQIEQTIESLFDPGAWPLGTPVFVAIGRYDYGIPFHRWSEAQQSPSAHLRVYERSGHTPQLEQPNEFTAEVAAWAKHL